MHFDELRRFSPKSLEAHRKDRTYSLENLRCHSILRISCKSYNCTSAAPQSQNPRSCKTTLCSDSYRSRPPLLIDHRLNNFTSASSKALNQQTQIHLLPASSMEILDAHSSPHERYPPTRSTSTWCSCPRNKVRRYQRLGWRIETSV